MFQKRFLSSMPGHLGQMIKEVCSLLEHVNQKPQRIEIGCDVDGYRVVIDFEPDLSFESGTQ